MAEIVEANLADARPSQRPLEALADLTAFERMAGVRMAEYQVILGLVRARLEQKLELTANAVGHRNG